MATDSAPGVASNAFFTSDATTPSESGARYVDRRHVTVDADFEARRAIGGQAIPDLRNDLAHVHRFRLVGRHAAGAPAHLIENRLAPVHLQPDQARVLGERRRRAGRAGRSFQLACRDRDGGEWRRELVRGASGQRGQRREMDNSVRSKATSLIKLESGYMFSKQ